MYSPQLPGGLFSFRIHFKPNFKQENKSKLIHYQQSDVPLNDLCKQDILLNQLVWPEKFARVSFKDMCDKLNGYMPSITDQGNLLRSIENKTLRRYSENVYRDLGVDQNVGMLATLSA